MIWLALLLALQDPVKDYRRGTPDERAAAVAKMRDTDTIVRIAAWDPDVVVRLAALDALAGRLADHDVQELALRILFAPFDTRATADAALREARRGAGDVPGARLKVHAMLRTKPHEGTLAILRDVLAGHTRQIASFVRSREGGSLALIRSIAAEALGATGGERDVAALIDALGDPEPRVRAAAARALRGNASVRSRAGQEEPDPDVRFEARRAIGGVEPADVEAAFVFEPVRATTLKRIREVAASLETPATALRIALVPIRDCDDTFAHAPPGLSSDRDAVLGALDGLKQGPKRAAPDAVIADAICRLNWSRGSHRHLHIFLELPPQNATLVTQVLRDFAKADGAKVTIYHAPGDTVAIDLARLAGVKAEQLGMPPLVFDANVARRIVLRTDDATAAIAALRGMPGVSDVARLNDGITLHYKGLWSGVRALESPGGVTCTLSDPQRHRLKLETPPTAQQVSDLELEPGIRKLVAAGGSEYDVFTDVQVSLADVRAACSKSGIRIR